MVQGREKGKSGIDRLGKKSAGEYKYFVCEQKTPLCHFLILYDVGKTVFYQNLSNLTDFFSLAGDRS